VTERNPERIAADLAREVKGDIFADVLHRAAYSSDASIYRIVPACVVAPRDSRDIAFVVKYAAENGLAVAARGAGSGVAGESLCSGIILDVTCYMNRIISIDNDGSRVVCEPGVVLDELNNRLAGYGRKIGPDPSTGNRAVIGGCVANNATGAHSLQYGYMGDWVEGIEAVLADGSVVELKNHIDPAAARDKKVAAIAGQCANLLCGKEDVIAGAMPKTKRNRSGYMIAGICRDGKVDLARLMGGSEGTLAIFTKITLRTVVLPKAKGLVQLEFDGLDKMAKAAPIIVGTGASAVELMDRGLMDMAIEQLPGYRDILPAEAVAVLLVEHIGDNDRQVKDKIEKTISAVGDIAKGRMIVLDPEAQKRLWKMRKDAAPLLDRRKGRKHPIPFIEDASVENDKLDRYIAGLKEIGSRYGIAMSFYGHAGDGELHVRPYLDLSEPGDVEKMQKIANDVFTLVWSLGGSISGEHADGLVRAAFIRRQYGDEFYDLLCKIKNIFDPKGTLNPGKIINDNPDVMITNLKAESRILPGRNFDKAGLVFAGDEIALELEQCNGCGVCRGRETDLRMCPVFRAAGEEIQSSRAKAEILRFWATGQMEDDDFESPEFRKFLDLCVNCKACAIECPSGVDISKLMAAARAEYVRRKGLRRAEWVLGRNRYLSKLGSTFSPIANFLTGLALTKWFVEQSAGLDRRRRMPRFAFGSFLAAGRKYLKASGPVTKPIDRVAYFIDTYANFNDHELGYAVLDVLRANNIEVILPNQRPAPLPAIVYGDVKTAKWDLSYSIKFLAKAVRDGYKIVCSEPSAALCLKQELRHYVTGEDAKLVSDNTYELMEYLLSLYSQGKLKESRKKITANYVYHTPCHLFAIGAYGASIELLQGVCGVKVVDLKAGCCGLAGTFGMQKKNYELSEQIAKSLKDALDKSPTPYVLTECAACKMQIEHISDKIAIHPVKVLAECYSGS
jgi:anaerobic glycerol-3-phosphate dehydrogenase C subunit